MSAIIIAEAGVNHNGRIDLARRMVHAAKEAGADYVKFQTAVPELVISEIAPQAEYQKENTGCVESQLDMCRRIHLPLSAYAELKALCEEVGIGFMSTPFDPVSVDTLAALGQDWFKIPSGEITNLPYLRQVASKGIPVILSTGMSTLDEVEDAVKILTGSHPDYPSESRLTRDDIIVLHCTTQYPAPFGEVNLKAMKTMADRLGVRTGYSDHTPGTEVAVAAAALGAAVIEKHFTLSRQLEGPDHKASLEPLELADMIRQIRSVESALGDGVKRVAPSEEPNIEVARKSIVAARAIRKGETLDESNLAVKRPGNGLSPMKWDFVCGTRALRDYEADSLIDPAQAETGSDDHHSTPSTHEKL